MILYACLHIFKKRVWCYMHQIGCSKEVDRSNGGGGVRVRGFSLLHCALIYLFGCVRS